MQRSRQANPGDQFNDPTRDWSMDFDEHVHTINASLDIPHITSRTSAGVTYDFVHSTDLYTYRLAPNSTLPPVSQLPTVLNEYHRVSADVRDVLTRQLALPSGIV
jgi:hypothetical protein